jgi:uncharacterized protein (DUF2147 family)
MKRIIAGFLLSIFALSSFAVDTVTGTWRTFDDKTKQPNGQVIVYEENGIYYGKIDPSFKSADKTEKFCTKCSGEFKDKPFANLRFMWNFNRTGDNKYTDGKILDPNTGDIYSASMHLENNGQTLVLRGYLGIPMFGSSQRWSRIK